MTGSIGSASLDEVAKLKALIAENEALLKEARAAIAALDRISAKDERDRASAISGKLLELSNQTLEAATDILKFPKSPHY